MSKIKVNIAIEIYLLKGKRSQRTIAKEFGVAKTTVQRIHIGEQRNKEIRAFLYKRYRKQYLHSQIKGLFVIDFKNKTVNIPAWKADEKALRLHHRAMKYVYELRDVYYYNIQFSII